ncbi:hypothetical protein B0H15DRAFT_881966 [Mycena belliarum]|uniref:Uncharacterized protein n=1 Tax=Mycena belliarum TaxID=1033014 RepID=A0AAD6U9K4_9AGAR|nr:hypothetical protein B0H15DRAFT_881966 [Mycena belliae]
MQAQKQQRRMTAPASSLQPPEGGYQPPRGGRPPSPLRQGYLPNTFTGIDPQSSGSGDEDDDREEWARSPSPSSFVSQAASFARSVGTMVSNIAPRSPGTMPTDAELEAEAERERDRSRREAERILTREAQDRRLLEERVLAMMESTKSLPPPPSRSQSLDPPSPSSSQKESGGWWTAAKNRLTPTKELTPAQQVIQEAKTREKEKKNSKGKEKEWPANAQAKFTNPSLTSLIPPPQRRPAPNASSPTTPSPTPSRPHVPTANMPPNLTPSPMRYDASSSSPREREREVPPLYAHFDETTGTLDVHVTLLTIAKRFEKLEKWTVGHVRALEERMGDVERWLVDKENEKEQSLHEALPDSTAQNNEEGAQGLSEIRDGLQELQSRVTSLGREMAKLATAPANLSHSTQARYPAEIAIAPLTPSSSFAIPSASPRLVSGHTARESTSPPMASSASTTGSTRLPYPTGDYASPPDSTLISLDTLASSPTSVQGLKARPVSGLPPTGALTSSTSSISTSYSNASFSSASSISSAKGNDLPLPKSSPRLSGRGSVSPTPRKRYTVALGGSVESDSEPGRELGTAMFSGSEEGEDFADETIGKSAAARLSRSKHVSGKTDVFTTPTKEPRMRAQSAYGLSSILQASPTTTPLTSRPAPLSHGRSRSIDRFGTGNFVDPLVLRKQSSGGGKDAGKTAGSGNRKVPVGQLVAFFDGERK